MRKVLYLIMALCMIAAMGYGETMVIDNRSDDYSETGSWNTGSSAGYHVTNYRFADTELSETAVATWDIEVETSGTFDVYVWYVEGSNRASDAKYIVNHSSGSSPINVDQTVNGAQWHHIGTFGIPPTGGSISLSNESSTTGKVVIADAIKIVRQGTSYSDLYQGMWIYSWGSGFLSEPETNQMMTVARDNYLNIIFPEVRKVGDAYYQSATEPRADNIDPSYTDPLADIISKAHDTSGGKQYIEVHAWIVPYRVWTTTAGPAPPAGHVAVEHPEWLGQRDDGVTTETGTWYLDPGVPEVTDYLVDVALEIVQNYDVDGIHWDYFRYPGEEWGYNQIAIDRFNALYGKSGRPNMHDSDFDDFRRDQIRHMGRKVYAAVKAIDWDCKMSAATIQWGGYAGDFTVTSPYAGIFQDWPRFMNEGLLDMNVLMNYKREHVTDQAEDYRDWANFLAQSKAGRHAINGPGVYMNSIHNSITQVLYGMDVTDIDGTNIYVYHMTNQDGDPADDFWSTMRADCYTQQRDIPTADWIETPTEGILRGAVEDLSGNPVDGATITLSNGVSGSCKTDGTGFFAFLKLPPGIGYEVTITADGYPPKTMSFDIMAGQVTTLSGVVPVEISVYNLE